MLISQLLSERFSAALSAIVGRDNVDPVVQLAGRPEYGDYQVNGIMGLAKPLGRKPRELAEQVLQAVDGQGLIAKMEVAGAGFINVTLAEDFLCATLQQAASDTQRLGVAPLPPERVVVDYSSVNLAKEMHVGHLRSTIIGDALARVHAFLGHTVIRQNHVGDWGTQFGMLVAFLVESRQENAVGEVDLSDLESFYRQAKARFDDPAFADLARQYVVRLQAGDPEVVALWRHFVEVSMSHCDKVYERLGVQLQRSDVRGESAYNDDLPGLVEALRASGLAQSSQGADVVTVDEFKGRDGEASTFMVRKKDGGFMYGTTDLAAIRYRVQALRADRCLYVVDSRQALHFQQLFVVARRAGFAPAGVRLEHIAFGMVLGKDGKPFKTREGESVKLTDLLNEAVARADALVASKNPDMPAAQREQIAQAVGIGAVKYADLSKNRTSDYVFDWNSMLSFEGNTAPYLQYACVRVKSIVRRAGGGVDAGGARFQLATPTERALGLHLLRFGDVLGAMVRDSSPHVLCTYLYELAAALSRFYEQCQIIGADGAVDLSRLKLSQLAERTLTQGLQLLGITELEEM
jgi:arginyl-tRNA synthetase